MIYAHDFNMEFCGYGSDVSGSLALNFSRASTRSSSTPVRALEELYCPLDIVSYGSAPFQTSDYEPANPLTACTWWARSDVSGVTPCAGL